MRYTANEGFEEVKKRGRHLKIAREVKIARLTGALSCVLAVALLGVISVFSESTLSSDASKHYGSFILSAQSGLYILLAVIFFVIGFSLTLGVQNFIKHKGI